MSIKVRALSIVFSFLAISALGGLTALFPLDEGGWEEKIIEGKLIPFPGDSSTSCVEVLFPEGAVLLKVDTQSIPSVKNHIAAGRKCFYFSRPESSEKLDLIPVLLTLKEPEKPMEKFGFTFYTYIRILDARGVPAEGFEARLMLPYVSKERKRQFMTFEKQILDNTGMFPFDIPQTSIFPGDVQNTKSILVQNLSLLVINPSNGMKERNLLPHWQEILGTMSRTDTLWLSMVKREPREETDGDIFRGEVVDASGQPINEAVLTLRYLVLPEKDSLPLNNHLSMIYTNQNGKFELSLPRCLLEEKTGTKNLSPGYKIIVMAFLPEDSPQHLPVSYATLSPGEKMQIVLMEPTPTPTPMQIIHFRKEAIFKGHVLDVRTGLPIQGAYVVLSASGGFTSNQLAAMEKWERDRLGLITGLPEDGALQPIPGNMIDYNNRHMFIYAEAIGKTGTSGTYYFSPEMFSSPWNIHIWTPGMIGVSSTPSILSRKDFSTTGVVELSALALLPATTLRSRILPPYTLPDHLLREEVQRCVNTVSLSYIRFIFDQPKEWFIDPSPMYLGRNPPWKFAITDSSMRPGDEFQLCAPADVLLTLSCAPAVPDPVIKGVRWENIGPFKAGEIYSIPPKEAELSAPFIIKVVRPDGFPAEGIQVLINGEIHLRTNEAGTVIGWTRYDYAVVEIIWELEGKECRKRKKLSFNPAEVNQKIPIVTMTLNED